MSGPPKSINCPNGENDCPIYKDIAELKHEIAVLNEQILRDALTGLYNKRHMLKGLETEMERTQRSGQPTSLIMFDADHFKNVNDTHGHSAGDRVLKSIAKTIQAETRKLDIPCRYGGEEFAVILPTTPLITAVHVAERIRGSLENTAIEIDDNKTAINITASLGVSSYDRDSHFNAEAFINKSDQQLYKAKTNGRNQVCWEVIERKTSSNVSDAEREALFKLDGKD